MTKVPHISVVICTRNRGEKLRATLRSLTRQDYDGEWELIVVNNGSTDDTQCVIDDFAKNCAFPLRVAHEPLAGLSRARNKGLARARGEIVAFTDDDCYPREDFLSAIAVRFAEGDVTFVGGRVLLFDPDDQRVTIQERNTPLMIEAASFVPSGLIHGANMAVSREALMALNGFDERLGAGSYFKSGEDTDMLRRLVLSGMGGAYDPRVVVFHHHERKTVEAAQTLLRGYCRGLGSCMLKYVIRPDTRPLYLRVWYWRLRRAGLLDVLRELTAAAEFYLRYGPTWRRVWEHPHDGLQCVGGRDSSI